MKKILFSVLALFAFLIAPVFADVTVHNRTDRVLEAYITDSSTPAKSLCLTSQDKESVVTSKGGGTVEIRAWGNKDTGEVLAKISYSDGDTITIRTDEKGNITLKKTRRF